MPRIQVQDLVSPELTQVRAQPVSTLTPAAITPPPQTNSFLQLASALTSIQPSLNQFLDTKMNQVTQESIQAGQEAQMKNKVAFKDAVKGGAIPAGANPWFVQGYQEQSQRINGIAFDQSLRQTWASSDIRNSDDPQAFKSWMQDFTSQYVDKNGISGQPGFHVFQQSALAAQENLAAQHIGYRQQDIEKKTMDGAQTLLNNVLDYPLLYNGAQGQIDAVKSVINAHVANGLNPTVANKLVVDSIITKAKQNESISDLEMIGKIDFGHGSLGKTQYARDEILQAEAHIARSSSEGDRAHKLNDKIAKDAAADSIQSEYMAALVKDPNAAVNPYIQKGLLARVESEKLNQLHAFKLAALTDSKLINEDTAEIAELSWRSMNGQTTKDVINSMVANKQLTLQSAIKMQENLKDSRNSAIREPLVNDLISGVYRQFVAGDTTDQATIAKGNAIRNALGAEAIKMAADGKSPMDIVTQLIDKANKYQEAANFNASRNKSVDPLSTTDRTSVSSIEAKTKALLTHSKAPTEKPKEAPKAPVSKVTNAETFSAAVKEYNESQGTKGTFVEEAKAAGVPVAEYIKQFTKKK